MAKKAKKVQKSVKSKGKVTKSKKTNVKAKAAEAAKKKAEAEAKAKAAAEARAKAAEAAKKKAEAEAKAKAAAEAKKKAEAEAKAKAAAEAQAKAAEEAKKKAEAEAKAKAAEEAKKKAEAEAKAKAEAEAKKKPKKKAKAKKAVKKEVKEEKVIEKVPQKEKGKIKVISVDDEEVIRILLNKMLTKAGYEVKLAASGEEGLKVMKKDSFDLAIIDLKMPGMGGMAFLGQMKELYPDTEAVILTGFGDIDTAVDAMKKGAFNFIPKPFKKDTFLTIIERALERRQMKKEIIEARTAMREAETEAAKKIGQLESQIAGVEEAKRELGEQFNSIKDSLISGKGDRKTLENKVMALEKVAGEIKDMEEKLVSAEEDKKEALDKVRTMEDQLNSEVSSKVELGNKLDEAKKSLGSVKEEVDSGKDEKAKEGEEISLGDIHKALSDFRKEIEGQ